MVALADLAAAEQSAISKPYGSAIYRSDYVESGIPVVRGVNLARGRFHDDNFVYIDEAVAARMPGAHLGAGDMVFTHRGSIGQVSMIPREPRFPRYVASTSQVKVRLDAGRFLPEFYFYWFQGPAGRSSILAGASVVGVPGLARPVESVKALRVPLPTLEEQWRIAGVLGALDDLVELDRHLSLQLTATARAAYDRLVEPWSPGTPFSETVEVISGGTPKTTVPEYWDGGIPWYSVADAPAGDSPWVLSTAKTISPIGLVNSPTRLLPERSTIISARGTVGTLALVGVPMAMNQSCYGLRSVVGSQGFFTYFSTQDIVDELRQSSHGSVFDTITRDSLSRVRIRMPDQSAIGDFELSVSPLMDLARELAAEIAELNRTRDELLPLLMSGQVRVSEDFVVA